MKKTDIINAILNDRNVAFKAETNHGIYMVTSLKPEGKGWTGYAVRESRVGTGEGFERSLSSTEIKCEWSLYMAEEAERQARLDAEKAARDAARQAKNDLIDAFFQLGVSVRDTYMAPAAGQINLTHNYSDKPMLWGDPAALIKLVEDAAAWRALQVVNEYDNKHKGVMETLTSISA